MPIVSRRATVVLSCFCVLLAGLFVQTSPNADLSNNIVNRLKTLQPFRSLFHSTTTIASTSTLTKNMSSANGTAVDDAQVRWRKALDALPGSPEKIPSFFFAHGSPMLAFPAGELNHSRFGRINPASSYMGPNGPLGRWLKEFGPALREKYNPKAIVVFSAHWETSGERLVTNYGDENPLLYDYYGFQKELYELKFKSKGDTAISDRVVSLFKEAGMKARLTSKLEPRGADGRGFEGPGLDHGVFVPFMIMFGEELDIPVVQASIDSTLRPEDNWKVGQAVKKLREENILVLSGGLSVHNLRDFSSFTPEGAKPVHHEWEKAVHEATTVTDPEERKKAMFNLVHHPGFRASHPREDHFVPIYVAAGAGEAEKVTVLNDAYGMASFAFGS